MYRPSVYFFEFLNLRMGFISHQFLLDTYIDNTKFQKENMSMIAMKNCSASFIRNHLKDQINFDQIMIHHPLVKEMSILEFFFFMSLWYIHSQRVSKEEQLVPAAIRLIITVETCQMINSFQRFNLSLFPLIRV